MSLLSIDNLSVSVPGATLLRDVSLAVAPGEVLGVIGESGAGKSMTANAITQLLPPQARVSGQIALGETLLTEQTDAGMNAIRGARIGMVFQEPMTALNPLQTIGDQVAEAVLQHQHVSRRQAHLRARETLEQVGLPAADFPLSRYPHQLSGGQRQRVVIAMAIVNRPELIIADEPTTALDVTTQAQILRLLRTLVVDQGVGLMLISHDLAVVAELADALLIMQGGKVVERGPTATLIAEPKHPYTRSLLAACSTDVINRRGEHGPPETLMSIKAVSRDYVLAGRSPLTPRQTLRAVDGVSFDIGRGEHLGLVGESGCGKSTLCRALLGLETVQAGEIQFCGQPLLQNGRVPRALRRKIQVVFQDPYASFNPRHQVSRLIAEPFHLVTNPPKGAARAQAVATALAAVNLPPEAAERYIHEFSGGQRQRIAIARALVTGPELIILDEAVSSLDVQVRAQILDLLATLSAKHGLSYLFISHDLSVVRAITDRVLVMKAGKIVESGETATVFAQPQHPYTRALIAATPIPPKIAPQQSDSGEPESERVAKA